MMHTDKDYKYAIVSMLLVFILLVAAFACGVQGPPGPQGPQGEQGAPGLSGSIVTPVVTCPSLPGSYPEVLLCIDDVLFAVYADGGSATKVRYVELPPGVYTTTDGRDCTFRVISGCEIE